MNKNQLKTAIKTLLIRANTVLDKNCFDLISKIEDKNLSNLLLSNCKCAKELSRPLCQDTGQVLVFLKIPYDFNFGFNFKEVINDTVREVYESEFYRKSVVKDAFYDRENTKTNAPALIYSDFEERKSLEINILLKGAGAENMSFVKMFPPTVEKETIIEELIKEINERKVNACPPLFVGIGVGGTMDYASVLSKVALFDGVENDFCKEIKNRCNNDVLLVRMKTAQTHIACMPVAVTINCHSNRHASCEIGKNGIIYNFKEYEIENIEPDFSEYKKVNITDGLKELKPEDKILLSGTIYTMRDMAHKKVCEMIKNKEKLPFEIKNSVIFYAGPTPKKDDEVVGVIGPTTSKRMDKFAPILYDMGCLATIGKGERSKEVVESIKKNNAHYFVAQGGIACLLKKFFVKSEFIAFEELGTEAIYKYEVKALPLTVKY